MGRSGKTVITPQFGQTGGFSEGLANVQVGTKWGYINRKGLVAITPQFDFAVPFRYGRARVKLGDRWGFIDKDGKYISSPNFRWMGLSSGDLAPVQTADGVIAFVNRSGKLEMSGKFESLSGSGFTAGLARAASSGKWGYIDTTGKWVIDPQFEGAGNFADGLAPVQVGGRWGYIDRKGKFVVNPQYDAGDEFYEGLAGFRNGGKIGFIDTKGRVVVEARFLNACNFSDGLAAVKTEGGWGFIDQTGKMVISPQFDEPGLFQNGLARVTALGKEAYITTTGAFVVDPFPGTTVLAERARRAALGEGFEFLGQWDGYDWSYRGETKIEDDKPSFEASIARENGKYKMLFTAKDGSRTHTVIGACEGGKIGAKVKEGENIGEDQTLEASPDGSLIFMSRYLHLRLKKAQQ
jgi:hypothetical protein